MKEFLTQDLTTRDLNRMYIVDCHLEDLSRVAAHISKARSPILVLMVMVVTEKSHVSPIERPVEVTSFDSIRVDTSKGSNETLTGTKKAIVYAGALIGLVVICLAVISLIMWR